MDRIFNGLIMIEKLSTNPSRPPFAKGRGYPSLAKRGKGRFYGLWPEGGMLRTYKGGIGQPTEGGSNS
jgi:hypothetical protein